MDKYKYLLSNGKHLVINADHEPSDDEIEREAKNHGVMLATAEQPTQPAQPTAQGAGPSLASAASSAPDEPSLLGAGFNALQQGVRDTGIGALKGIGDMAVGAGQMVHKVPGVTALVDKLYGTPGLSDQAFSQARQELASTNGMQSVGKGLANIGTMMLAPAVGGSGLMKLPALAEAAGIPGLLAGAQTGGDPESMAAAAALGAGGQVAGKLVGAGADKIRKGQALHVADARTAKLAKAAGDTMDDPFWINARNLNEAKLAGMMKKYGLTGRPSDLDIIKNAPSREHEILSALSNQLNKKNALGHEWSMWSTLAGLAGLGAGGAGGVGVVAPAILGSAIVRKFPGQAARVLSGAANMMPKVGQALSGLPGSFYSDDPMTQALMEQEQENR